MRGEVPPRADHTMRETRELESVKPILPLVLRFHYDIVDSTNSEARRLAETPGITVAERADLLAVAQRWLALAGRASESTGARLIRRR